MFIRTTAPYEKQWTCLVGVFSLCWICTIYINLAQHLLSVISTASHLLSRQTPPGASHPCPAPLHVSLHSSDRLLFIEFILESPRLRNVNSRCCFHTRKGSSHASTRITCRHLLSSPVLRNFCANQRCTAHTCAVPHCHPYSPALGFPRCFSHTVYQHPA